MISVDFETRSTVDLRKTGVYPYARHPHTDLWCMAYAVDDEPVQLWHPGEIIDERLRELIVKGAELHAWNAQFERVIWREVMPRYGWPVPELTQWHCSMARAANYGLPLHLGHAAQVLSVEEQKDDEGHRLMMQMAKPRRYDDAIPVWWDTPDRVYRLGEYCRQDVRTERAVASRLQPLSERERKLYLLDQRINDRGVYIDQPLALAARDCAELVTARANDRLAKVTGGAVRSVTRVADITRWLRAQGVVCDGIAKADVREMMRERSPLPAVDEVLQIRTESAKSSVAKLDSMLQYANGDSRMRGLLAYHGASTGRWAGRGPQPQNFPRGEVKYAQSYIPVVLDRAVDVLDLCDVPLAIISTLLRSVIRAAPGRRLQAGDYSAIEARVLAWLAGHTGLLDAFRRREDVYKKLASAIYNVPIERVTKDQRWMGKTAILGLGYQMGAPKFCDSCATNGVIITEAFAKDVVTKYRDENKPVVKLWDALNAAALQAMRQPGVQFALKACDVRFQYREGWLYLRLPSGRTLKYAQPELTERATPWGEMRECVTFMGFNAITHQWQRTALYGGLLAENVTQAVARDLLADAMLELEAHGYPIVLTVHDEIVCEVPVESLVCEVPVESQHNLEEFTRLMTQTPAWAADCPVAVEAWEGDRYRK